MLLLLLLTVGLGWVGLGCWVVCGQRTKPRQVSDERSICPLPLFPPLEKNTMEAQKRMHDLRVHLVVQCTVLVQQRTEEGERAIKRYTVR